MEMQSVCRAVLEDNLISHIDDVVFYVTVHSSYFMSKHYTSSYIRVLYHTDESLRYN